MNPPTTIDRTALVDMLAAVISVDDCTDCEAEPTITVYALDQWQVTYAHNITCPHSNYKQRQARTNALEQSRSTTNDSDSLSPGVGANPPPPTPTWTAGEADLSVYATPGFSDHSK